MLATINRTQRTVQKVTSDSGIIASQRRSIVYTVGSGRLLTSAATTTIPTTYTWRSAAARLIGWWMVRYILASVTELLTTLLRVCDDLTYKGQVVIDGKEY